MLSMTDAEGKKGGLANSALLKTESTGHKGRVNGDDESTKKLIDRARGGDKEAFEELVIKYEHRIRAFCSLSLRNEAHGDDAAQEVFLKAYRSIGKFRGDSTFSTWLFTLARNQIVDFIRRDRRTATVSLDEIPSEGSDFTDYEKSSLDSKVQAADTLDKMLRELSVNHRFILLLKEFYGLSYDEISSVLNLSLDGVKGQLKRARVRAEEVLRHLSRNEFVEKKGEPT